MKRAEVREVLYRSYVASHSVVIFKLQKIEEKSEVDVRVPIPYRPTWTRDKSDVDCHVSCPASFSASCDQVMPQLWLSGKCEFSSHFTTRKLVAKLTEFQPK